MANDLLIFNNEELGCDIRVIRINGKELFVAKDVAKALGYSNYRDAIRTKCKGVVKHDDFKEGGHSISFIGEPDVYRLIFGSKLDSAVKFQDWVFEEVLPQIRQTGGYIPVDKEDDEKVILSKAILILQKTLANKDSIIKEKDDIIEEKDNKIVGLLDGQDRPLTTTQVIDNLKFRGLDLHRKFTTTDFYTVLASLGYGEYNDTDEDGYKVRRQFRPNNKFINKYVKNGYAETRQQGNGKDIAIFTFPFISYVIEEDKELRDLLESYSNWKYCNKTLDNIK